MKILKLLVVISLLSSELVSAQNSRFSQIGTAQMLLNPSLTGRFDGKIRLTGLYSAQSAKNVYGTGSSAVTEKAKMNYLNVALDFKLGKFRSFGDEQTTSSSDKASASGKAKREAKDEVGKARKVTGYWGVGLNYQHVGQKDAPLAASFFSVSLARHFYSHRNKYFGIGIQGTYAKGDLDINRGDGSNPYNQEISTGSFRYPQKNRTDIITSQKSYLDYNIGAYYGMVTEAVGFELGGAMYHLFYPHNDIYDKDDETKLRHRVTAFSVLRIKLNPKWGLIQKNIYWQEGLYYRSRNFRDSLNIVSFWSGVELIKTQPRTDYNLNFGLYTRSFRTVMPYLNINLGKMVNIRYSYEFPLNSSKYTAYTAKRHEAALVLYYGRNTAPGVRFYRKTNFW
ncbi:MAG: type IX secretion system membrane protein PorP/SprF [Bacteroidetes bacterium]|nr:type IX secretion system membrane protein PorP/SprF [Bacteroidota bacterium]